ncbi:hypothetical protein HOF65_03785 [bacterium]|nr:hypothetical protein [bacterium]
MSSPVIVFKSKISFNLSLESVCISITSNQNLLAFSLTISLYLKIQSATTCEFLHSNVQGSKSSEFIILLKHFLTIKTVL